MRPMLKAALRRSWRGRACVQFGVDPERAVVLEPVDGAEAGFLDLLDGTRGGETLLRDAAALGLGPDRVRRLLGVLARGGVLDDAAAHAPLSAAVRHRTAALDRLRPDLAALSLLHPAPGAAAARIRHRRAARVRVHGAGRVGAQVAALLSAAGVGAVDLLDGGRVEPWDTAPGGIPAEHVGDRRDAAGRGAVRRAAPDLKGVGAAADRSGPSAERGGAGGGRGAGPGPVVAVLAPRDGLAAYAPEPAEARRLVASGVPHLYTGVVEGLGVVGPLVVPGRTACGECLALKLADGDPHWPRMLAQLRSGRQPAVPACDVAQATAVAGLAAAHVLAHLDGRPAPGLGARVELSLARLATRTRALPADPRCGCGAAGAAPWPGGPWAGGPWPGGPWPGESADGADEDKARSRAASDALFAGASVGRGTMAM
ncbi:TOMM precursor leader peptide-binding protein [Streptomyces sp. HPF1205]|uniref:TOMM precursor leader peptide-binding protein n=1 Tax=Streptomyces sp. HPF1205 TaxID=2873262 RepID=UPI001CEDFDEE|nr:TOMM precursor leader peptide-binding protein [Streptomyces sp. HPF1205]